MNLIQKVKNKIASRHSFKKNELADMGPGKVVKAKTAKKATKKTAKTAKKGKKNVK